MKQDAKNTKQAIKILRKTGLVLISVLLVIEIIFIVQIIRKNLSHEDINHDITGTPTATPILSPTQYPTVTETAAKTPTFTPTPIPSLTFTPTPTPSYDRVTMISVGDNLYDWYMLEDGMQEDGSFNFDGYYSNVEKYIALGDFAVVNQETMFGGDEGYIGSTTEKEFIGSDTRWGSYHGFFRFNTPDEVGLELIKSGFNIFTCATNHSSDYDTLALHNMLGFFKKHPEVTYLGIHDSQESQDTITVVEKNGIKLALLNYTFGMERENAIIEEPFSVDILSWSRVTSDIKKAKKLADFVIVFPHWGTEYMLEPDEMQKEYTRVFLQYGVDVVVGGHSHTAQPIERFVREDGHEMTVYYSLGNFISIFKDADCQLEGMAYIEFCKDGDECFLGETSVIPLVNHWEYNTEVFGDRENFTVYALQDYTEQLTLEHGCVNYPEGEKFSYEFINQMAKDMWGENIKFVKWQ